MGPLGPAVLIPLHVVLEVMPDRLLPGVGLIPVLLFLAGSCVQLHGIEPPRLTGIEPGSSLSPELVATREAIADGYDTCAVTSVPAVDVEGAVLDHVQKLLAAPELVARTWATAKREGEDDITEREVTVLLADFATVWAELFPAEQARIAQLLVERVDVQETRWRCGSEPRDSASAPA